MRALRACTRAVRVLTSVLRSRTKGSPAQETRSLLGSFKKPVQRRSSSNHSGLIPCKPAPSVTDKEEQVQDGPHTKPHKDAKEQGREVDLESFRRARVQGEIHGRAGKGSRTGEKRISRARANPKLPRRPPAPAAAASPSSARISPKLQRRVEHAVPWIQRQTRR